MPNLKNTGFQSELSTELKNKKQQVIEEERIRILGDALMLFYDKLMENYKLVHLQTEEVEEEALSLDRDDVEQLARDYAATKPLGY